MQDLIYDSITGVLGGQCQNYTLVLLNKALDVIDTDPKYLPIRDSLIQAVSCIISKSGKNDVLLALENALEILKTL